MITYEATTNVARSPEDVFAAVVDIGRWSEWTDMRDIRADGDALRVGSTGRFELAKGPFKGPLRYEATQLDPGRRVVYHITHPALDWTAEVEVAPDGPGSRLVTRGTMALHGIWRLLQPIIGREIRNGEAAELERLKAILESGAAADAPVTGTTSGRTA